MSSQRVVLVTGASSGVGQSTARLLSQKGYKVFGTSRKPSGADATSGVEMLALDVGADDSVAACLKAVSGQAGRIDVLVNNAGSELAGALEEISLDEAKAQFRGYEEKGPGPELVAETVLKILNTDAPRLRHMVGQQAKFVSNLRRFAPAGMYEQGIRGAFLLDKKG
jgi:NAD(P)-dependent dehydrogenase (short-subunit alcohol dehydrogenase family)